MLLKLQLLGAFLLVLAPLAVLETVEQSLTYIKRQDDSRSARIQSAETVARAFRGIESGILGTETGIEEAINSTNFSRGAERSFLRRARGPLNLVSQIMLVDQRGQAVVSDPVHRGEPQTWPVTADPTLALRIGPTMQVLVSKPWIMDTLHVGSVIAVVPGDRLDRWLRELDPGYRTLIITQDGTVVADTWAPLNQVPRLPRASWLHVSSTASRGEEVHPSLDPYNRQRYQGAAAPIFGTPGWMAVSLQSEAQALASVRLATRRSVEVFGIVLLGSLLVAWVLGERLSQPLHRLSEAATALGHGDLDRRLPAFEVREYAAAATAFNEMAERLATQAAERDQLLQRAQEDAARMEALFRYSEALVAPLDLRESTAAIVSQIRGLCPAESVSLWAPGRPNADPRRLYPEDSPLDDRALARQAFEAPGVQHQVLDDGTAALLIPLRWVGVQACAVVRLSAARICDPEQLRLISILRPLFSALLHNALRYQREQSLAESLQDWFTVPIPVALGRLAIGYGFCPGQAEAQLGGDLCDVFAVGEQAVLVIGDVCGKGLEAAVHALRVEHLARAFATESVDPADILTRLNRVLTPLLPDNKFVTLRIDVVDLADLTLRSASAGHEGPLRIANGRIERLPGEGLVLGINIDAMYETRRTRLSPGDLLLWCTDGILEARSATKELWGDERLAAAVRAGEVGSPSAVVERVLAAAQAWVGSAEHDDMTLLAIQVQPVETEPAVQDLGPSGKGAGQLAQVGAGR